MNHYHQRLQNCGIRPRLRQCGGSRRGVALLLVIWLVALAGIVLLAISARTANDARRTRQQQTSAQIDQWLTAANQRAMQPGFLPNDADSLDRTLAMPVAGVVMAEADGGPTCSMTGQRNEAGSWQLEMIITWRGRRHEQALTLAPEGDSWRVADIDRAP